MKDVDVLAWYLAANGAVGMVKEDAVKALQTFGWLVAWLLALVAMVAFGIVGTAIMSPWFLTTWLREWRREYGKRGVRC